MSIFQNNPIIDWMDYMFYRITKFYLKHKEEFEYWRGFITVSGTFALVALSILFVIFGIIGLNLSNKTHKNIILSGYIISFIVFYDRYTDKKRYEELCKRYKNETHYKVKGVAVVATILLSFALFILGLYLEHILVAKG